MSRSSRRSRWLTLWPRPRTVRRQPSVQLRALPLEDRLAPAVFFGGVHVAVADVNGDGTPDIITGAGAGGGPHVKVFDGKTNATLLSFYAYDPSFKGGVFVAAGDVNGDGKVDIVTGAGNAGPHVKVFSNTGQELFGFMAYDTAFRGGVSVAAADVNGDGKADIVTGAGPGGGSHVKVFSGADRSTLASFFAYDAQWRGGVNVAAGDTTGDGKAEIITGAGAGGGPHVKVFTGTGQQLLSFFAYDAAFRGGVTVGTNPFGVNTNIVTGAGAGGGPHVKVFNGKTAAQLQSEMAFDIAFRGGVFVADPDLNGDGTSDVVVGAGETGYPLVRAFNGATMAPLWDFMAYDPGSSPTPPPPSPPSPPPPPPPSTDTTKPTLTLTEPASGQTVTDNVTIKGQATDAGSGISAVQVKQDIDPEFRSLRLDATGHFEFTTKYRLDGTDDGAHTVQFRAIDKAGNVTDTTFTLTIDTANLSLHLDAASDTGTAGDGRTEADTITLVGTAPANAPITLVNTGATTTADANGDFRFENIALTSTVTEFTVEVDDLGTTRTIKTVVVRNTAPAVVVTTPDLAIPTNSADTLINLPTIFSDIDVNSLVTVTTNRGQFSIELFDQQVGPTVANFVKYVTDGDYTDTIFHRTTAQATAGIDVLQGGGFKYTANPSALTAVSTDAPIALQTGLTNERGTIAMARTSVLNSATSQFFLNTLNNKQLDTVGGGYSVFGVIRGDGMQVVDAHHATPPQDHSDTNGDGVPDSAFGEIPLINYAGTSFPADTTRANYEIVDGMTVTRQPDTRNGDALTFSATSSNTNLVTTNVTNGKLTLKYTPGQTGTSTITLTATDKNGQTATVSFNVTVG